jgi:lysyl-tRNA synthetase class 2
VRALELTMLTKSFLPLPEKYHGLSDVEQRYRQRYLDLIMNESSRHVLRTRSKIVSSIRQFMDNMGAIEVETPMLHPILGGASAKPFMTHHNALDATFYLRVAPELYLKKLIVGGFADAVYEIGRNFRNEGLSVKHNPEYTAIEGYHAYMDYFDIMNLIEDMIRFVVLAVHGTTQVQYGDQIIDFGPPWARKSMVDLVKEETGVDFLKFDTAEEAREAALGLGIKVDPKSKWGQVVEAIFGEKVEHKLIQPIHVMDHPLDISPLSKVHRDNPRLVERFESYVNGWEISNAFTELNDPRIQYERFMEQVGQREGGDEEAQMLDEDFITALEYGLPPTGGWGVGVDRLVMILTDSPNIRDVICFPTLKPLDK